MPNYLNKDKILLDRDENGKLLPVDIVLDMLEDKPMIKAIPIMKGELNNYFRRINDKDDEVEADIISKHCIEPKFTKEEAKLIKMEGGYSDAILIGILSVSVGRTQDELKLMFEGGQKFDEANFRTTEQT